MQLLNEEVDRFRGLALCARDSILYRQRSYECGCCEVIVVKNGRSSHNFYVFVVYRNPDLSDKCFDCLVMVKVQSVDRKAFFCLLAM